jgi:CRISPR/Cas system-associated endoribonuclease Cas2
LILLVSYDLHDVKKYSDIHEVLESYDNLHAQASTWVIDTEDKASEVRDRLQAAGDEDDSFLVVRLRGQWATRNVPRWREWIEGRTF